jgi:hypothetical protein
MLGASGAHRNIAEETGKNRDRSKRAGTGHSRTILAQRRVAIQSCAG